MPAAAVPGQGGFRAGAVRRGREQARCGLEEGETVRPAGLQRALPESKWFGRQRVSLAGSLWVAR